MFDKHSRRRAAACALALVLASPAFAQQTLLSGPPAQYRGPAGDFLPAGVYHVIGTVGGAAGGAPCIIGIDANCLLPGTGVGGGAGGLAVTAASGAYAAGALSDGSSVTLGTKADNYVTDPTLTASQMAVLKGLLFELEQPAVLAGSNSAARIGAVTTDQTTPGTTDLVHAAQQGTWSFGLTGALPAFAATPSFKAQDGAGNALTSRPAGSQRAMDVALNDGAGNQIGTAANPVRTDPTGTTTQPVSVASLPLPSGAMQQTGGAVSAAANTVGGASTYSAVGGTGNALLSNSAVAIAAGARSLYSWDCRNNTSVDVYLQWFDLASGSVTLGTTVAKFSTWIPASGGDKEYLSGEGKIAFATALTLAATTTPTGSAAPATGLQCTISYK